MIILDSCIWIAFFHRDDSCHKKAFQIINGKNSKNIIINDHIYAEILNVLRNKTSEKECADFITTLNECKIEIERTEKEIITLANFIFFHNPKLSFTDSIIIAQAATRNADFVTFDQNLQKAWKRLKK